MLTLHHLETSRSSRVIWLLEALGTPYELVVHKRGPDRRAQADLKAVHPLGKAPVIVDGDITLCESATILRYIHDKYGAGRFTPPPGTPEHARHEELLDYVESSLMPPAMTKLLGLMTGGLPPGLDGFATGELNRALTYVASHVQGPLLFGASPTLADMQLAYSAAIFQATGMLKGQETMERYAASLQDTPGYQRMVAVGGPLMMS